MSDWGFVRIGDICKTGAGGTPRKSNKAYYEGGTIPWLVSGEVAQGEIFASKSFITEEGLANSSAKIFPTNTVLVAMYGATAGQVGILHCEAATNQAVCGILPSKKLLPEFVFYAMLSKQQELISQAVGNAQPNISQAKIKNTKIPSPPISEQKRIVTILDDAFARIDAAIANTEKNITNARELFESYLNRVFEQKGDGWKEKTLGELCSIKHGFAFKSEFFKTSGDYILLTPGSFYESGGFRGQGKKTKYYDGEIPYGFILKENDFLFAMTEQAKGLLGSSLIVPDSNRYLHNQRLGLIQPVDKANWDNLFFHFQFNTNKFRDAVQTTASGVKVRHTSPKKLQAITVSFPSSSDEQKKISSELQELKEKTNQFKRVYQKKLTALHELRHSILQKAFSGKLTADMNFDEQVA